MGDNIAKMAWVSNGLTDGEAGSLAFLLEVAVSEPRFTTVLLQRPWLADMPGDVPGSLEWNLFNLLWGVSRSDPELGLLLVTHPVLADEVTHSGMEVVELLIEAGISDLEWARSLAATDWMSDGVEGYEIRLLSAVVSTADTLTSPAEFLLDIPSLLDHVTGDLREYAARALIDLGVNSPEQLEQVIAQQWFSDGLTTEEAVLIVILKRATLDSPELFDDLLAESFAQTAAVDLPLTGRVRLWAVQNTPFLEGESLLRQMEEAVRYWEGLVQQPFPTDDVILSVVDPGGKDYGLDRGAFLGTHMRLIRSETLGTVMDVPHETGHYFFRNPRWFAEGVSQFGQAHLQHLDGVETLEEREEHLILHTNCFDYANIRHFQYESKDDGILTFDLCAYDLGENFMLNLFSLIGEEAISLALRELYIRDRDEDSANHGRGRLQRLSEEHAC